MPTLNIEWNDTLTVGDVRDAVVEHYSDNNSKNYKMELIKGCVAVVNKHNDKTLLADPTPDGNLRLGIVPADTVVKDVAWLDSMLHEYENLALWLIG